MMNRHLRFLLILFCAVATVTLADAESAPIRSLAERPVLVVGARTDNSPYSALDREGRWSGFTTEVLDGVARVMKLRIERRGFEGNEVTRRFRAGEFDIVQTLTQVQESDAFAEFSVPVITLQGAIFVRRGGPIKSLADFEGRTFAVVNTGSLGEKFIRAQGLHPRFIVANSPLEALTWVNTGKCDGTFISRLNALVQIQTANLQDTIMLGEPLADYDVRQCFAVHRGDAQLLARLNEGLTILRQNGEYDRIYRRWFGIYDAPLFTREELLTAVAAALALAFGAALWGLQRQRTLTGRIHQINAGLETRVAERTAELATRVEEVERLNEELEAFSYSVSHDLRSPLRNIGGFLELLGQRTGGKLDPEALRYMATISAESERMRKLIDDLLAFSRLGRASMKEEPVPLDELVAEVRRELQSQHAERAIVWTVGPLPVVRGDRALLRSVVVNLLGNAVKFTGRRAPAVIEIGTQPSSPGEMEATIFVRDNGAGFNPKYIDKLFGVFQRLHTTRDFEGTGIGLANVKRIITRHGGRVWAEGNIDKGAVFYFTLRTLNDRLTPIAS